MDARMLASAQCVLFAVMVVLNYLATSETAGAVRYTNSVVADTHPVYGLPNGWAFAIWGIIFLTLGMYTVYQAMPARCGGGLECALVEKIRVPVLGFELFNSVWNFLFGNEQYWLALVVIVLYVSLLWVVIRRLAINYFLPIAGKTRGESLRTKIFVAMPFSAQCGWVTVATALNVQVNLLDEGHMPSPGLAIGCCWAAVALGLTLTVLPHADLPYALVTLWALGGIISNQSPDTSTFGCVSRICDACNRIDGTMSICARVNTAAADRLPNGWGGLDCASYGPIGSNVTGWGTEATVARNGLACIEQVVPKSPEVVWWSVAGMACVAAAWVASLVYTCCAARPVKPTGDEPETKELNMHAKMEAGHGVENMPATKPSSECM